MNGGIDRVNMLTGHEQMTQIRAAVTAADGTAAAGINRPGIVGVSGVFNMHPSPGSKQISIPGVARRHNAVEHEKDIHSGRCASA